MKKQTKGLLLKICENEKDFFNDIFSYILHFCI